MSAIKWLRDITEQHRKLIGGKGCSLGILVQKGFNVPNGFVLMSSAFFDFLVHNNLEKRLKELRTTIDKSNIKKVSSQARTLLLKGEIPTDVSSEVQDCLEKLRAHHVSIRSSASSEDSSSAAFAGLYDTFLNVESVPDLVLEKLKQCWASLFNERAVAYLLARGIPDVEGMAVIIQVMVPAEASGVTFTAHPMEPMTLVMEVSYGLGNMIVCGEVDPDHYVLNRHTLEIVRKKIGQKHKMTIIQDGKIRTVNVQGSFVAQEVLSDDKIKEVAGVCLSIEHTFDYPQNIEWCISNERLWLLQSRPVTTGEAR